MKKEPEVKIGDIVWYLEPYRHRKTWREGWAKRYIIGETSVSWIVGRSADMKLDSHLGISKVKKTPGFKAMSDWALSEAEINERNWDGLNRSKIAEEVRRVPIEKLRAVADLIGYVGMTEERER